MANEKSQSVKIEQRLHAVIADYMKRRDAGQKVDQQSLLKAYPDLADGLRSYFQGEAILEDPALAITRLGQLPAAPSAARDTHVPDHAAADTASEFTARTFGRYQLLRPLGEGAMGSVYLAQDTTLDRRVALKMPRKAASEKARDNTEFLQRFTREARAAAGLKHVNICSVYDAGEIEGTAYITMDFIDGVPLSRLIGTKLLQNPADILKIVRIIADAVAHAHEKGIIHRDLKPGNILVDNQMNPFVTDFGLARREASADGSRITQEGLLIGTPAYMAPEQVRGEQSRVGVTSDIYSLGVIFFELLTTRLPFEGSVPEMLAKVLRDAPPIPSRLRSDLTDDMDDVVLRMLDKEPGRRYQSMKAVVEAIDGLAEKLRKHVASQKVLASQETDDRASSPFEIRKAHIEQMLKKGQYASAIQDLESLAEEQSPAAAAAVEWARRTLPNAKKEAKALSPSGLKAMLKTAEQLFEKSDYQGCIQLLEEVPSLKRTEAMETLLQKSKQREVAAEELMEQIRDKERRENPEGLEALVKKYLKLKPGNAYAKKLWTALQTYSTVPASRRSYRFERGRLQPMPEMSLFRRYALLAVLVGVLSFLVVYSYVVIYLKSGSQTLAVHVDDEWLKEQGGQLTLVVDGDEHTISTAPANGESLTVVVKTGDREFSVKHGDAVVHNPRTFTIERNGKSVLQITRSEMELRNSPLITTGPDGRGESSRPDGQVTAPVMATNNSADSSAPWIDLFDGKDTSRWKTLGEFKVESGLLVAKGGRTMAVSEDEFGDFELEVEWRLSGAAPNGGIYYRELATTSWEGNEYQLIDPAHQFANTPRFRTGALYGVLPTKEGFEKPPGEWNSTKIVCRGPIVEHWLNNELLFTYNTTSDAWKKAIVDSTLKQGRERIGTARKGHLLLQGQTGEVAFRRVRVRELPSAGKLDVGTSMASRPEPVTGNVVFQSENWSTLQGATLTELIAWKDKLPANLFPHRITLRAGSVESVFDAIAEPHPSDSQWVLRIADSPDAWQQQLEGFRPVVLLPFRDGNTVRGICVGTTSAPFWSHWIGSRQFISDKLQEGMRDYKDIPQYLGSMAWHKGGEWQLVRAPSDRSSVELHSDLSEQSLADLLKTAQDRQLRPMMIDHLHSGGTSDLFAVLVDHTTGVWGVSLRISSAHLARLIPVVQERGGRPTFMASTASSGEVVYRVIWRGIDPEVLKAAEEETRNVTLPGAGISRLGLPSADGQMENLDATSVSAAIVARAPFDAATAAAQRKRWAAKINEPEDIEESGIKLKLIPPGEFTMGSPDSEQFRLESEGPQHSVRITQPFFMGLTEITQKQWVDIMGTRPWQGQPHVTEGDQYPACYVSWNEVKEFCRRLSTKSGQTFRLPTEAEWEYACRAGTTTVFHFGDDAEELDVHGWQASNTIHVGNRFPHEVAKKKPNPFGLYDMHGNLFEWCEDLFVSDIYAKRTGTTDDPMVLSHGEPFEVHITRGGAFDWNGVDLRSAFRGHAAADFRSERDGFRVVRLCKSSPEIVKFQEPATAPFPAMKARAYQQAWADHLQLPVQFTNSIGMKFRLIPPGSFMIGSTPEQIEAARPNMHIDPQDPERLKRLDSESPRQRVTLSKPFYLGVTEVTLGQFETVVGPHPVTQKGIKLDPNVPVSLISWVNTGEFCGRLTIHEGLPSAYQVTPDLISQTGGGGYRLPTEAEWEFACRAGTETLFSTGDSEESLVPAAWMGFNNEGSTKPVAQRLANPFGLFDMHGNAAEWVHDGWRPESYQLMAGPGSIDPRVDLPVDGLRVIRGGSHFMHSAEGRSASRSAAHHDSFWSETGFRVALSVDAVRMRLLQNP